MKIEINPRTLLHLQEICEVLYKLHPYVLDYLLNMQRSLGNILGFIDLNNPSLEEREFLSNNYSEPDYSKPDSSKEEPDHFEEFFELGDKLRSPEENEQRFYELKKYLKLDTDEYIPIQIFIEIEDPVVGRKVRELVRALETTRAIDQFTLNKRERDEDAYFAEGYGLQMNKDQKKQMDDFFKNMDVTSLRKTLISNKLYE